MKSAIAFPRRRLCKARIAAACVAGLLAVGGCSRAPQDERDYREAMEAERRVRDSIRKTLSGEAEDVASIRMVREKAAPEGGGTTEQWVKRFTDGEKGTILFPRWYAERRGVGRFEVRHVYTLLMDDGRVEERGHAWAVDLALKLVEGPFPMTPRKLGVEGPSSARMRVPPPPPAELIQD